VSRRGIPVRRRAPAPAPPAPRTLRRPPPPAVHDDRAIPDEILDAVSGPFERRYAAHRRGRA